LHFPRDQPLSTRAPPLVEQNSTPDAQPISGRQEPKLKRLAGCRAVQPVTLLHSESARNCIPKARNLVTGGVSSPGVAIYACSRRRQLRRNTLSSSSWQPAELGIMTYLTASPSRFSGLGFAWPSGLYAMAANDAGRNRGSPRLSSEGWQASTPGEDARFAGRAMGGSNRGRVRILFC